MASDILGLFTTPQQYEQQRLAAMEAQALQSARLSPMEQGQYGIALGAQQLGRAIGGALGGEDPQLKIISQRQALAGQLDPSNPDSYMKVAQIAAQSGDQKFAIAVADAGRQAAVQVAQANKERQLAVPADIQKAQMIPQIQDALDQYKLLPPSPERDRAIRVLENQLKVLIGDKATNIAAPLQVANRIAEITRIQANLDPASQDYKILQAEKDQLQRPEKPFTPATQIQVANRISEITRLQATLDPESQEYKVLQAEKIQLERSEKPAAIAPPLQVAERLRQISVAQRSLAKDSPEYQDLEVEKLQLQKAEKQEAIPKEIQIATRIREINVAQRGLSKDSPEYQDLELEKTQLQKTEKPEKNTQIEMLQTYRDQLVVSNAPKSKIAEVEAVIKSLGEGNAPKIIMPGQPVAPKDWLAFSSQISKDPVMDRTSTILADAPSAIETIRMSTTNDIAAASLPGSLARLTGEGKNMSNQDVNRFARTGGLDDRLAQDAVGFFTGRKTNVTKEQAERFATAVYRGALLERRKFIKDQAEQAGYDKTPNFDIAIRQIDDQLAKFKLIKPSDKSAPSQSQKLDADSLVNKYLKQK